MFAALRSKLRAVQALSPRQQRIREAAFLAYHQRKHYKNRPIFIGVDFCKEH